jgi:hypothetical protein
MPEIKITSEEERIFMMIKKSQLTYPECKKFIELFCVCMENKLFDCKNGKKILHFDSNGSLRQIESQIIDYKA